MEQPRNNLKRTLVYFGALVVIALAWKFAVPRTDSNRNSANENTNAVVNTAATVPTVQYEGVDGKNALDLLKESHAVVEDNGFVKSIDGRENADPIYWTLYANGAMAQVGAKDYMTKTGDTLEWRYESYK